MMFNSPTAFCSVRRMYVAIDQTQHECALENGCEVDVTCPLQALFARRETHDLLAAPDRCVPHASLKKSSIARAGGAGGPIPTKP